jgi:hypothetical protein
MALVASSTPVPAGIGSDTTDTKVACASSRVGAALGAVYREYRALATG